MSVERRGKDPFDADAARFDAIYDDAKGPLDRSHRRGLARGRTAPLPTRARAARGGTVSPTLSAAHVVGVDFAAAMIELAQQHAQRLGVLDHCDFRVGSFPEAVPDGPFDASKAMGFFHYVADPVPILQHMGDLTRGTMIMSFSKAWEWRVPFRRLRFFLAGCPLFLYSASRVCDIPKAAGIGRYEWIELDRDYAVVATLGSRLPSGERDRLRG